MSTAHPFLESSRKATRNGLLEDALLMLRQLTLAKSDEAAIQTAAETIGRMAAQVANLARLERSLEEHAALLEETSPR